MIANTERMSVANAITTKPVKVEGFRARFAPLMAGNVKDYTGKIEWDEATVAPVELTLNQRKYFAFGVDDIEEIQADANAIDNVTSEQAQQLAEVMDTFVLDTIAKGAKAKIGTTTTKKEITKPSDAYDYIADMSSELGKAKAPMSDRFVVVNNELLNLLIKDDRFTRNPEVLANGIVTGAKIAGMTVIVSEEVGVNRAVALHKNAIGFAQFIDEMEGMRLESAFSDGIRGLSVYDAKMLKDKYAVVLNYTVK